ncbi:hypothetical protein M0R45_001998 [Rubus argutus]|uniref:Uncharacterized protein n=1 Tax=Rubus argutus TaxID=59490 RepID=A0AAW1VJS3_RUBAR
MGRRGWWLEGAVGSVLGAGTAPVIAAGHLSFSFFLAAAVMVWVIGSSRVLHGDLEGCRDGLGVRRWMRLGGKGEEGLGCGDGGCCEVVRELKVWVHGLVSR